MVSQVSWRRKKSKRIGKRVVEEEEKKREKEVEEEEEKRERERERGRRENGK